MSQSPASPPQQQLHMLYPADGPAPALTPVPEGYRVRQWTGQDAEAYIDLMQRVGFDCWSRQYLAQVLPGVLEEGFFVVEHEATGRLVATAMAQASPTEQYPQGGELGWVAADPPRADYMSANFEDAFTDRLGSLLIERHWWAPEGGI